MEGFASKEKQSAPAVRKVRPYVHYPTGPVQLAQRAKIRHILRSTGTQAKLTVGAPNDKYEQEADRVADQVMRMPDPKLQRQSEKEAEEDTVQAKPLADRTTPLIQRQAEPDEEEEESVQPGYDQEPKESSPIMESVPTRDAGELGGEEDELIQTKPLADKPGSVTAELHSKIQSLKGGGQTLPASERAFFEPRFGRCFGNVRVHSDNRAGLIARSINARAFTHGRDVVFGSAQYAPSTSEGRRLMAHELTHVVQQDGGRHVRQKRVLTPLPLTPLPTPLPSLPPPLPPRTLNNLSMSVQNAPAQLVQLNPSGRRKKKKAVIRELYKNLRYFINERYRSFTSRSGAYAKKQAHNWLRKVRSYISFWLLPERSSSLNNKIIKILRSAVDVIFQAIHLVEIPEKLEEIYKNLLKIKYKPTPDEYAKAWKYRRQYKSKTQSIRNSVPKKYKKLLSLMHNRMPKYQYNLMCGYDALQYLWRLIGVQTVGVAKVIPEPSYQKQQKRYPGTSKWLPVFERDKVPNHKKIFNNKQQVDTFHKDGGKWSARLRSNDSRGYTDKTLKMFDLIRIGTGVTNKGKPTGLHYVVWLGGDNSWVIDSYTKRKVPQPLTIKKYKQKMGGNIVVQKIIRSTAIASAIP